MGPYQVLPLRTREELGAMAVKGYSTFPKAPALLKPHHQIVSCHKQDSLWESLTLLLRCSWCILQPQPTGPLSFVVIQNSIMTSLSDCFVSYPGHSLRERVSLLEKCVWCLLPLQPTGPLSFVVRRLWWCNG